MNKLGYCLILSFLLTLSIHAAPNIIPSENVIAENKLYPTENVFSFDYIQKHNKKIGAGGVGYVVGATSALILGGGSIFGLIAMPIGGAIGSGFGVYVMGDMQKEESSAFNAVWGGCGGAVIGVPVAIIPGGILLHPLITSLFATKEYNMQAQEKTVYHSAHTDNVISLNPVATTVSLLKSQGKLDNCFTPVKLAYERKTAPNMTMGLRFGYANARVTSRSVDFFGEVTNEGSWWQEKYYAAGGHIRWYLNPNTIEGWYLGSGCDVFYSSITYSSGDIESEKKPGNGWFLAPSVESGYTCFLMERLTLDIGYNLHLTYKLNASDGFEDNFNRFNLLDGVILRLGYAF